MRELCMDFLIMWESFSPLDEERVALSEDHRITSAEHRNNDDSQHKPGDVDWPDQVERCRGQWDELEVDDHEQQDNWDRGKDYVSYNTEFIAMLTQVEEGNRQTGRDVDEQEGDREQCPGERKSRRRPVHKAKPERDERPHNQDENDGKPRRSVAIRLSQDSGESIDATHRKKRARTCVYRGIRVAQRAIEDG